jgi:hypothetical protein
MDKWVLTSVNLKKEKIANFWNFWPIFLYGKIE